MSSVASGGSPDVSEFRKIACCSGHHESGGPSPEHKDYMTSAGPGKLRSDASACPRDLALDEVTKWLRDAVRAGNVSAYVEGDFPRYAWTRAGERVYEARLCNSGSGEYKGYPILSEEAPGWLP